MSEDSTRREKRFPDASAIQAWMISRVSEAAAFPPEQIDARAALTSYGLDSLMAFEITGDLAGWLGRDIPATLLWDYPTIELLAKYLSQPDGGSSDDE